MSNNNQQYDTKCLDHPNKDIELICSTCPNNTPVCINCISDIHNGHSFKKLKDINLRNQIQQEYNQTISKLNNYLENNKIILDESNNHFKQIKENNDNNFNKASKIFKELKDIINAKENDIKRLLTTKFEENKDLNNIITTTIENNNNAIKYNNDVNNNINNNDINCNNDVNNNDINNINYIDNGFIKLLKHNHQCNNLLSKINNNNLPKYKDTQLIIQENNLDSIKDLINCYLKVVDDPLVKEDLKPKCYLVEKKLKTLKYIKYQLISDSIPATVIHLFLLDGFNQPLNFIPPTVKRLNLHNIKYQLIPGSIPNHLNILSFDNGFSQRFIKGIIPDSLTSINMGDVVYPLEPDSISNPDQII
ncbi:hypothetical protein DICPUDRAFT_146490 [Dictyostelium purpureum]|uniref:B box-type domain-containing protein n=1 Tax=Dictyostelium purpureum TaxID=5786 RepID=F0Z637_DICPU|nr:uncharacterized protein DICPUDRAFT_146490 [Dictyostelium purpureum]EGC40586.1 hypothetical protein DICPUDRAFT_146490 [Dictyostelium purpureum]|eukprot:XP_003282922.1 hypothetical protein DICPUDRAFT_146490 [Dictyostelium purpureum]